MPLTFFLKRLQDDSDEQVQEYHADYQDEGDEVQVREGLVATPDCLLSIVYVVLVAWVLFAVVLD